MVEAVKQFVQNVIVIMLLAAFLQIILPSGSLRKYAQLAVGLLMVLTLLTPLLQLSRASFNINDLLGQAAIRTTWEELQMESQLWQQQNHQTLLQSYRQVLTDQIRQLVESSGEMQLVGCQLSLVEDSQAEDFGRILGMSIQLHWRQDEVQPVTSVQPVQVGTPAAPPDETPPKEAQQRALSVRTTLSSYFVLAAEQVQVSIK